MQRPT
jgi:hypothetical protein